MTKQGIEGVMLIVVAIGIFCIFFLLAGCSEGGSVSVNQNQGSDQQNSDSCTQTCGCNDGGADASCCPGCSG